MKKLLTLASLTALLLVSVTTITSAQSDTTVISPFGITLGMSKDSALKILPSLKKVDGSPISYLTTEVPTPHSYFQSFIVVLSSKGVCKVVGIGKTFQRDSYGTDTKATFQKLNDDLTEKYGKSETFDYLDYETIWKDAKDWMMALYQNERSLKSFWTLDDNTSNVGAISLIATALNASDGYVRVAYEVKNFKECIAEITATDNSAL